MAGHSHSANIARRKNAVDAKRGKLFSKLARAVTSAARQGGPDPEQNLKLKYAIEKAKAGNMPKDNIERAIKKGIGALDGAVYDEILYEGYGPGGVAVLVETMTDNKNRTVADIRHYFAKSNGNLGESGCVGWMFDKRGVIVVDAEGVDEEELMDLAIEAGAEDVIEDETTFQILTAPEDFSEVVDSLEKSGVKAVEASLSMVPKNTVEVTEEKVANALIKLLDNLEDHDDVQKVHANFDIADDIMEKLS